MCVKAGGECEACVCGEREAASESWCVQQYTAYLFVLMKRPSLSVKTNVSVVVRERERESTREDERERGGA